MMEPYDPTLEALVAAMLDALGVEAAGGYIEQLRQLQLALVEAIAGIGDASALPPDGEQVMRQALGRLDPKNTDAELDSLDVLRRVLAAVDRELFRWDSSIVQFPGPSGEAQTALTAASPILESLRPV